MTNVWSRWADCHDSIDQKKRLDSAKKSACTPIHLDFTTQTGKFKGSSGKHTTTLAHCTCIDFNRRKLPCKHMYRLAMELGLVNADFASNLADVADPVKKQNLADTVALIENFSEEAQRLLKEILYNMNSANPVKCVLRSQELSVLLSSGILVETNSPADQLAFCKFTDLKKRLSNLGITCAIRKKQELISWILDNASDRIPDLCYDSVVISASECIKTRKIYMYLHRKYDAESTFIDGTYSVSDLPLLKTVLPDDDVTMLLRQYGYYSIE